MEYWLTTSPWPGVVLWIILYISDYSLTIYSARGFQEIDRFHFEGSFELTPQFQKDIDALKPVSRLHLILLVLYSFIIVFLWWLTKHLLPLPWNYFVYLFFLGMFLLLEAAIHLRHLRNVSLIRECRKNGGIEGQILYKKWFTYRISAREFYTSSVLFLIIAILAYSPFFLGGAMMCCSMGLRHNRLAKKVIMNTVQAVQSQT